MQDIRPLYGWITDSVIAKARPSFLQDGVDEAVLEELKARWEQKLVASNVFDAHVGEVEADDADGEDGDKKKRAAPAGAAAAKKSKAEDGKAVPVQGNPSTTAAASASPAPDGAGTPASGGTPEAGAGDDKEAENSDDELLEPGAGDDSVQDMVLAQYEKVTRNRNKWTCTMKHGIVHIDGREYVFGNASGVFLF